MGTTYVQYSVRSEKDMNVSGSGATVVVVVSSHVFAGKLNIGLLEEQQVLNH